MFQVLKKSFFLNTSRVMRVSQVFVKPVKTKNIVISVRHYNRDSSKQAL